METTAIHRAIEGQAANHGDAVALADAFQSMTYRELNQRANGVARCLVAHGFGRGAVAIVNLPRSMNLAVACLGVLKAGGAYTWMELDATWPRGISIQIDQTHRETRFLAVDITRALTEPPQSGPNLPILTRGSDVACVITGKSALPVLVPHETVTSLTSGSVPSHAAWQDEAGALDLWVGLIAGATVLVTPERQLSMSAA